MYSSDKQTNLHFQHAECNLEQNGGSLIEEQIPQPQQNASMHNAREQCQKPVQGDQRQL